MQTIHDEMREKVSLAFAYAEDGAFVRAHQLFEEVHRAYARRAKEVAAVMSGEPLVTYRCPTCQSEDVCADAAARWNSDTQEWEMATAHDCLTCDDCGRTDDDHSEWRVGLDDPDKETP